MRKNTLHKFLFSHIAIEFIVLLTIIPFMIFALQSVREKQINESYSLVCSDINAISAEFRAAESMIGSMHRNPSIVDVINMKEALSGVQRYYAAQARKMWYATTVNWQLLHNNYVYFAQNEVVFSPDRIFFSWEDFYGDWLRYEDVDYASWRARLEWDMRAAQRGFYQTEQVFTYMTRDQSRQTNTITYQVPFVDPFNSGIVVFLIDVQELLDALRFDSLLEDSFLCLYDANNLLLFSRGEPYAVTAQEAGISEMRIDGTSYHIFTVKDAVSGLTYVIGTPSSFFTRSFVGSFGVLFGYTIIALLVASAASVFLARRQYSPLKEVYAFFKQHSNVAFSAEHSGDEYQYFLNSYMELLRSNQSIRDTIADYDAALTTRAMEDLLLGRYKSDQEMQKMCARVVLPGMWRVCTAVLEPSNCAVEKTALGVISVTLVETLKKAWKEKVLIHPLSEKRLLFIVPTEADGSAISIADRLNTVVHSLRSNTGVEVYFAVSGCYHEPKHLAHAYEEAGSILACRHTRDGNIFFPEDMERTDELPLLTLAASGKLREYVLAGDSTRAGEFIRSHLQNRYLCDSDYGQLFFSIRGILMQIAADIPGEGDALPFFTINRARDDQTGELVEACNALCASFNERKKSHNEQLKNGILNYLEENYSDPDVYGKSVAAHFSISEKYLYTFFREQTGGTFSSHLESLRLTQAAQLLDESKFTVNEIAQMVGFNSPNSFYKAFRRMYGIAPSAYRNTPKAQ